MFKNLQELITTMPDEKTCKKYLEQQRWNGKITCPYCGHEKCYVIENGERYKCASNKCYKRFTVTVGTIFHASNIPLNKWFIAFYLNTAHKKGISSCQLAKDISVTQKTSWYMLMRIRDSVRDKKAIPFKGNVQADEAYFGGSEKFKHNSKKLANTPEGYANIKAPVVGMYEDGIVRAQAVNIVTKKSVTEILEKNLHKDARLITDKAPYYFKIGKKHDHVIINHSEPQFVNKGFHVNGIENYWSMLKRGITGIYHHCSAKHLQRYCDEYSFRYNTRKIKDADRFTHALQNCEGWLPYKRLINNSLTLDGYGKEIETIQTDED